MAATNNNSSPLRRRISQIFDRIWEPVSGAPLLGLLLGTLVAVNRVIAGQDAGYI